MLGAFAKIGVDLVLCGHDHQEAVHFIEHTQKGTVISTAGTVSSRSRGGRPSSANVITHSARDHRGRDAGLVRGRADFTQDLHGASIVRPAVHAAAGDQLALALDAPPRNADELLARLRAFGLTGIDRCRLTRNRAVMVSYRGRELRVHEAICRRRRRCSSRS